MPSADIQPFISYVRSKNLYNEEVFSDATVFAVSSCVGEYIKLDIMSDNKVYPRVPICMLINDRVAPVLTEADCVYDICPDGNIYVNVREYLAELSNCTIYKKDGSFWQQGMYIFTVEWENKLQLHFIELNDGNYCFWGNDGMSWENKLP
jgi:hypothetical protein